MTQDEKYVYWDTSTKFLPKCRLAFENSLRIYYTLCKLLPAGLEQLVAHCLHWNRQVFQMHCTNNIWTFEPHAAIINCVNGWFCLFHQLVLIRYVTSLFTIVHDNMTNYHLDSTEIFHSTGFSTRCINRRKFYIPAPIRSCGEKFFPYSAIRDWNALPIFITVQSSFSAFRKDLMTFIINH